MTVNTKPIGVAYEDQNIIGADKILADDELGYTTFAQGSVTQATNKGTAVTLNKSAGRITMNNAALGATTNVSFTFNNDNLSVNDILVVQLSTGNTANSYQVWVDSLAAGSAVIVLRNTTAGSLSEAVVINFAVIHCQ